MGNLSRKAALGVAAALTAATTATVAGGVAGAVTATMAAPASRAVVAALAAPSAPVAPAVTAAPNCLQAGLTWPLTKRGATGERVYAIQQFLNQRIAAGLTPDADFGPLTEAAVMRFQTSVGLPADGQVGQNTWPRLCIQVSRGATGPAVMALQHNLNVSYGFHLVVDGMFGPDTEAAVRTFQMVERITVDGIAGPVTWNRIILHEP